MGNIGGFSCLGKGCPHHCCGAFTGVSVKLREMDAVHFSEIVLLPKDIERLKQAGKEEYIVYGKSGICTLRTEPDGRCTALCDGRCAIYPERPSLCRAYPLYLDLFAGLCCVTECPAFDPSMPEEAYQDALEQLLEVYQYWIDRYRNAR